MESRKINQFDNCSKDDFVKMSHKLDIPFRFQRDKSINKIDWFNPNLSKTNNNTIINEVLSINCKTMDEHNNIMIFPTISSGKLNRFYLQQNNNCNNCKNQRISLSLDMTQEKILFGKSDRNSENQNDLSKCTNNTLWNLKDSRVQQKAKSINYKNNLFESKTEEIKMLSAEQNMILPNQFFKAESILCNNDNEYRLPIQSITMHKKALTIISNCKPPPSPYGSITNGVLRNTKFLSNSTRKEIPNVHEKIPEMKNLDNDDTSSVISDDQCLELNDFEDLDNEMDNEMDLLDNLDSEITNDNSTKLMNFEDLRTDSESPTEDMLQEVHRLVNMGLIDSSLSNQQKEPFIKSLFSNTPPVIRFVREGESVSEIAFCYKSMMKWRYSGITPNVVKRVVKRSGFKLTKKSGLKWIGYFGSHLKSTGFKTISEHQKINHMPGSFQLGRKDRLWRNVTMLSSKKSKSNEFNFLPKTYCLPADLKHLKGVWDDEESRKKAKWILKPPASARGIGVKVISKWSQIPKKKAALIQSYVSRPFLINDTKFDLRVYVAVTSCDPLRIYVYREGLVRFASHKYSKSSKNMSNRFIHLTNYSVNKKNSNYQSNEDHNKCQGHKWTLKTLWRHFEEELNIDWRPIWKSIKDSVVKTLISVESHINSNIKMYCTHKSCVYELFGFDVLLDHHLKPWVLEVNVSPSLHSNSPLDIEVKSSLIADLFNLVGFQLFQAPDESIQSAFQLSHRPSLSASSIPISVSKSVPSSNSSNSSPDKKFSRTFIKQASLSSLNKMKTKKRNSIKSSKPSDLQYSVSDENEVSLSNNPNESFVIKEKTTEPTKTDEIIDMSNLQQRGYFNRPLTNNEKSKHKFYIQKIVYDNPVVFNTITDKLTVDDARILIESIDEFNRAGNFELCFPTLSEEMDTYLSYININSGYRYYNSLLIEFMKRYNGLNNKSFSSGDSTSKLINSVGMKLLDKYSKNLFLNSTLDDTFWNPPLSKEITRSKLTLRSSSAEISMNPLK